MKFAPAYLRLAVACAVVAALAAAVFLWTRAPASADSRLADALAGERWYIATFRDAAIGHYRSRSGRDEAGRHAFETVLRFRLQDGAETRMEDRLLFAAEPPHRLLRAEHASSVRRLRVVVEDGLAQISEGGDQRTRSMPQQLLLGEYLAVEARLAETPPEVGDVHQARSIDFDRLAVVDDLWRVAERDASGVVIMRGEAERPDAASRTRIRLDAALTPVRMEVGGLVNLERVDGAEALRSWTLGTPLFASAEHRVPVDRPIANAERVRRLVLAVYPEAVDWPAAADGRVTATWQQAPASDSEVALARAATLRYPAEDPRLRRTARRAVAGAEDAAERAEALTRFVHGHLRYRDRDGARSVFDTLRDRDGDCTEYADLFTALARAVGLPARTVVGLAYREQAFALHAWNEVVVDGRWQGVDPTWGLARLGARIPLPPEQALAAIAELPKLHFRVLALEY